MGKIIFGIKAFLRSIRGSNQLKQVNITADNYFLFGCAGCGAVITSFESGYGCQWGESCFDCTSAQVCFPAFFFEIRDDGCTNIPWCRHCYESRNKVAECA